MKKKDTVLHQARAAREAAIMLGTFSTAIKNRALREIARAMLIQKARIFDANKKDVSIADRTGIAKPLLKRLLLTESKFNEMVQGIRDLVKLPDPVGNTLYAMQLDTGLELYRVTCPIGVLGAVFESRPDALVQISCLCLKSGNAVLLKGGSEAAHSNKILVEVITCTIEKVSPEFEHAIQLMATREDVRELLSLDEYVHLLVPRGSNAFVRYIKKHTTIPVLGHADGICHVYVDQDADISKAVTICYDAKCQYPAVCNAMETLLVHEKIAKSFLPVIAREYVNAGVELRGCSKTRLILKNVKKASEKDWQTEYLDLILSIKVVKSIEEAVEHINKYGSHHTDAIVTENKKAGTYFIQNVDSASVMSNCSTRFADGFRYGLGAEVGISTNRIHARGPVGLEGLVTYNYRLIGNGQVVASYTGSNARPFLHKPLNKQWKVQEKTQ